MKDPNDPGKEAVAPARSGPTSAVVKLLRTNASGLQAEVERLRAERASGSAVLKLDPDRVRYGELPNRHLKRLRPEDPAMQELVELIDEYGQLAPIHVVPVNGDSNFDYEVVAGRRRVCACRILKAKHGEFRVLALLDAPALADPQVEAVHTWLENDSREGLSPYETGRMFDGWLKAGIFKSQDEIAAKLKRKKALISHYMGLYKLPQEILDAFPDPLQIALRWGQDLHRLHNADPVAFINKAVQIAQQNPRPDAETTYRLLVGAEPRQSAKGAAGVPSSPAPTASNSETIKRGGRTVFELKQRGSSFTIKLGSTLKKGITKKHEGELRQLLKRSINEWVSSVEIKGLEGDK